MRIVDTLRQLKSAANENNTQAIQMKRSVERQIALVAGAFLLIVVLIFVMSVAWYTNVSQTGSLTFQTEAWGFDTNKITAGSDTKYQISPGSTGIVPLTIDNSDSADGIRAIVTVDKTDMDVMDLRKRIFFYVDTPKTYTFASASGGAARTETVSRVWIGSDPSENYTYTVNGGEKLTLTEEYASDVPLKWMWVYDMEGYYFRGKVTDDEAEVTEYLRPLEYDLDQAVFDETEGTSKGQLVKIGSKTVGKYLQEITDADGFDGTLTLDDNNNMPASSEMKTINGKVYYRIAVDENDEGIWAYLCTYDEIQKGIEYDSSLASNSVNAPATIKVTVQNQTLAKTEVSDVKDLEEKLKAPQGQVLKLTQNLSVSNPVEIPENQETRIDLNGYALTYTDSTASAYSLFTVPDDAALTLMNGSIVGNGKGSGDSQVVSSVAVKSHGGSIVMSGVEVRDVDSAVFVEDNVTDQDSVVKITGCTFDTKASSVNIYGNGSKSEAKSRVIIEDSKITSQYIGVVGQGSVKPNPELWGTDVVLINDEISGYWAALYQPQQQSDTVIKGCTMTGYTGIVVKGGSVTVYDSTITGTGQHAEAKAAGGGWTDTGDGVYVEATYGWSASVLLRGNGNTITSKNSYAVELFGVKDRGPGKILTDGGIYNGERGVSNWNEIGTFEVKETAQTTADEE